MSEPVTKFMVQVLERRAGGSLWPVATVNLDSGGETTFTGDARMAFGPLLTSTQKATSLMVLQNLKGAFEAHRVLKEKIEAEGGEA